MYSLFKEEKILKVWGASDWEISSTFWENIDTFSIGNGAEIWPPKQPWKIPVPLSHEHFIVDLISNSVIAVLTYFFVILILNLYPHLMSMSCLTLLVPLSLQFQVLDGPDMEGNMFRRPGNWLDQFPSPYDNKAAAKAANNGVAPPDLTYIVQTHEHGQVCTM